MFNVDPDNPGILKANDKEQEIFRNQLSYLGNVFAEYVALELMPNAKLIASQIHAGPGEICFGRTRYQRADVTVVEDWGKIKYFNFHGSYRHFFGHMPDCPHARPINIETAIINEERVCTGSSDPCARGHEFDDDVEYKEVKGRQRKGDSYYDGSEIPPENPTVCVYEDTLKMDELKRSYAEAINSLSRSFVIGGKDKDGFTPLQVEYKVFWECFMHEKKFT